MINTGIKDKAMHSTQSSENGARMDGYTRELLCEGGDYSLHLLVKPDADLGQRFTAFDCDECEMIRVNGWLFTTEEWDDVQ